ncbi:MAG: hypothetical protein GY710_13825 [Desulfobacteraceae bacterium]|nr:hypothetical protein [Desulfobacteraceae bacterium]
MFGNTLDRKFVVKGADTVCFFAPHGSILNSSFYQAGRGVNRPAGIVEKIPVGKQCYDYNLTKFQGYHCKGVTGLVSMDKLIDYCYHGQRGLSYDNLLTLVKDPTVDVDVVTIRNVYGPCTMTLSRLIHQLNVAGYNYKDIFCSVCRGPAWISWRKVVNCGTPPVHDF